MHILCSRCTKSKMCFGSCNFVLDLVWSGCSSRFSFNVNSIFFCFFHLCTIDRLQCKRVSRLFIKLRIEMYGSDQYCFTNKSFPEFFNLYYSS